MKLFNKQEEPVILYVLPLKPIRAKIGNMNVIIKHSTDQGADIATAKAQHKLSQEFTGLDDLLDKHEKQAKKSIRNKK